MSEFSESFHLRSDSQEDGVELLRRAGLTGAVFSAGRGWVTVVVESELFEAVDQMVGANQGILLHYLYAEDHCWQFEVFEAGNAICQYNCAWIEDLDIYDSETDTSVLAGLLVEDSSEQALEDILHPADLDAIIDEPPAYRFAEAIGLQHYEWLGGGNLDGVEDRDPNVIMVR